LKAMLPSKLLFELEPLFRYGIYLFYKGHEKHCPICEKDFSRFIALNDDLLCPRCGSLSRTRRLWLLLQQTYLKEGQNILDFSPTRSIYHQLKTRTDLHYTSSDLSGNFLADETFDMTDIHSPDEVYDLIICYHVLEHIPNDRQAMRELYRVLASQAVCLIQTPFKEGGVYEDESITTKEERTKHFGQSDHVRIYSVDGLKTRLEEVGFAVELLTFHSSQQDRMGLKEVETILVCRKVPN